LKKKDLKNPDCRAQISGRRKIESARKMNINKTEGKKKLRVRVRVTLRLRVRVRVRFR
jgi:hypothetical protein